MTEVTAVLSMLHESPGPRGPRDSASRLFRGTPVLAWTLSRLSRVARLTSAAVVCWDDQADAARPLADQTGARLITRGPRRAIPSLDGVSAALRWTDGWRGGLLGATHFDRGFDARAVADALGVARAAVLVDPSSGLIDPTLINALIDHADRFPDAELVFSQAAPGLCGALVRPPLVDRLVAAQTHPGRLLSYWPDSPGRDPITTDACLAVAAPIARTSHRFTLDSDRQIRALSAATESLNGELISTDARGLVAVLDACPVEHALPRDVTLEVNTARATRPIYAAGTHLHIGRGDMPLARVREILAQLDGADDLRLTLAGTGDPLLHPDFAEIAAILSASDLPAIHVETDLVDVSERAIEALARGRFDVITVHLPAATPATYAKVMGVAKIEQAVRNLSRVLELRAGPTPIVVPTFTKCAQNLDEMEHWYDQFLRSVGVAAIVGPSDFAGQIPDHACADMSPTRRRPCQRARSRVTILSDGLVAACEQDALGAHAAGDLAADAVSNVWQSRLRLLRSDHRTGDLANRPLCLSCKEWHRP